MGMSQGVRTPLAERHDDELVALARGGDEQAFAELYQRYFRGLYDFTLRMVRDREAAADVVQATFVRAWTALRGENGVENVKAWLYAVARNLSIDELRRRQRLASPRSEDDEDPIYTIVDEHRLSDPSVAAHDHELVEMVWQSAAALSPQEYSLLDMHLRQGLDADELAEALGVAKGAIYTRLTRLRDSLNEAVTSTVLMRRGRRECEELDALLERLGATKVTREVRKAVNEHVKDCEICSETKRQLITPAELFAGLTFVPVPAGVMEAIWHGIAAQLGLSGAAAGAHAAAHHAGAKSAHGMSTATKAKALTALGTLGAVAIVGALLFPRGGTIHDPSDVHSTSHAIGTATVVPVVQMAWSRKSDAAGYSVTWTHAPRSEPDAVADLPGSSTGVRSPVLAPGRWWFHLRTRGHGDWTHTVHVGPFVITGSTVKAPLISRHLLVTRREAARRRTKNLARAAAAVVTAPLGAPSTARAAGGVAGASTSNAASSDGGATATPATSASAPPAGPTNPVVPPPLDTPLPPNDSTPPDSTPPAPPPTTPAPTPPPSEEPEEPEEPADKPPPDAPSLPPNEIGLGGTITIEGQISIRPH
jgi:RNA polymerase sigma factor (sigma-70 family)